MLIVHETGLAGYPFSVVQGNLGKRLDLVTADKNMSRANVEGWLSLDAARKLMTLGGQDLDALKKQALSRRLHAGAARPVSVHGHRDPDRFGFGAACVNTRAISSTIAVPDALSSAPL